MAAVSRGNVPAISPTGGGVAPKFELYEQVELKGVGGRWWTERYILTRVFDQGIWWYGITHPYQGNNGITQLSAVVEFPEYCLRHPENSEKLKVTGGIYNAQNFLSEYGKSILKAGVTRAMVLPVPDAMPAKDS